MVTPVSYKVSANGSVVMETLFSGTPHEMITMYHLAGNDLVATHYCAGANQPHFKLDTEKSTPNELVMAFDGGTNIDMDKGAFMHGGKIAFAPDGGIVRRVGRLRRRQAGGRPHVPSVAGGEVGRPSLPRPLSPSPPPTPAGERGRPENEAFCFSPSSPCEGGGGRGREKRAGVMRGQCRRGLNPEIDTRRALRWGSDSSSSRGGKGRLGPPGAVREAEGPAAGALGVLGVAEVAQQGRPGALELGGLQRIAARRGQRRRRLIERHPGAGEVAGHPLGRPDGDQRRALEVADRRLAVDRGGEPPRRRQGELRRFQRLLRGTDRADSATFPGDTRRIRRSGTGGRWRPGSAAAPATRSPGESQSRPASRRS